MHVSAGKRTVLAHSHNFRSIVLVNDRKLANSVVVAFNAANRSSRTKHTKLAFKIFKFNKNEKRQRRYSMSSYSKSSYSIQQYDAERTRRTEGSTATRVDLHA